MITSYTEIFTKLNYESNEDYEGMATSNELIYWEIIKYWKLARKHGCNIWDVKASLKQWLRGV